MRLLILGLISAPLLLSTSACGDKLPLASSASLPPIVDLEPGSCGVEPAPPTDDEFIRDPLAPQRYEKQLVTTLRCNVDARVRVCLWADLRKAKGEIIDCSLPKQPE